LFALSFPSVFPPPPTRRLPFPWLFPVLFNNLHRCVEQSNSPPPRQLRFPQAIFFFSPEGLENRRFGRLFLASIFMNLNRFFPPPPVSLHFFYPFAGPLFFPCCSRAVTAGGSLCVAPPKCETSSFYFLFPPPPRVFPSAPHAGWFLSPDVSLP